MAQWISARHRVVGNFDRTREEQGAGVRLGGALQAPEAQPEAVGLPY